jgi:hypothetical protein
VAKPVVDGLEIVDVEEEEGELAVVPGRAGALAREGGVKEAPVLEAGQGVEVGKPARIP